MPLKKVTFKEVGEFISRVGFPVAVACYLLLRMDYVLTKLTEAISDLSLFINQLGM